MSNCSTVFVSKFLCYLLVTLTECPSTDLIFLNWFVFWIYSCFLKAFFGRWSICRCSCVTLSFYSTSCLTYRFFDCCFGALTEFVSKYFVQTFLCQTCSSNSKYSYPIHEEYFSRWIFWLIYTIFNVLNDYWAVPSQSRQ